MTGSARIREAFRAAKEAGRPAFIAYVTAGYPSPAATPQILRALAEGGADVIELGVPFSDPLADGATIQHANEVALRHGVTIEDTFRMVEELRSEGFATPILLMGYYNPILAFGEARAAARAAEAGVDGFIVVDLPPEEAEGFLSECRRPGRSFVPLVAPTTSDERIGRIAAAADSFLYCVSVTGTTGARQELPPGLEEFLARVRARTELPLAVGFGISRREHVLALGRLADGVVVGSAIIAAIDAAPEAGAAAQVRRYVEELTGRKGHEVSGP